METQTKAETKTPSDRQLGGEKVFAKFYDRLVISETRALYGQMAAMYTEWASNLLAQNTPFAEWITNAAEEFGAQMKEGLSYPDVHLRNETAKKFIPDHVSNSSIAGLHAWYVGLSVKKSSRGKLVKASRELCNCESMTSFLS